MNSWPDRRTRRALVYVSLLCSLVVLGLGTTIYDTVATWSVAPDIRHYFLGIPIDALPITQLSAHHGAQLLVILGVPQVFVATIVFLFVASWIVRDRRLAYIALLGPISAEILTEVVAKPAFHRTAGVYYTYPSGHVTATASIMAVLALWVRRVVGRRPALTLAPFMALYVAGSMAGVIILHMHDLIDAVGGLAVGVGVVALWTVLALESRPPKSLTTREQSAAATSAASGAKTSEPTNSRSPSGT